MRRFFVVCVISTLIFGGISSEYGALSDAMAAELALPEATTMLSPSHARSYPVLKGLRVDPLDPTHLTFMIDSMDKKAVDEQEARRLVDYFLAAVALPQKDLWVNLSPYEKDRVVTDELGATVLGEQLLVQDYLLKQLSSSLTDPSTETGKAYWLSASQISNVKSENLKKIWIKPDVAQMYEKGNQVFVTGATFDIESEDTTNAVLLPAIKREVNEGEHFAPIRQAYYSIILGLWFKEKLRSSIFKDYIDAKNVHGIAKSDPQSKDQIFDAYVESFKKGVYSQTSKTRENGKLVKKAYFSGGVEFGAVVPRKISSSVTPVIVGDEYALDLRMGDAVSSSAVDLPDAKSMPLSVPFSVMFQGQTHMIDFSAGKGVAERFASTNAMLRMLATIDERMGKSFFTPIAEAQHMSVEGKFMGWVLEHEAEYPAQAAVVREVLKTAARAMAVLFCGVREGRLSDPSSGGVPPVGWGRADAVLLGGGIHADHVISAIIRDELVRAVRVISGESVRVMAVLHGAEAAVIGAAFLVPEQVRLKKTLIALDVGGKSVKIGAVSFDDQGKPVGGVRRLRSLKIADQHSPAAYYAPVKAAVDVLREELLAAGEDVVDAVGISHPGKDRGDGRIAQATCPNLGNRVRVQDLEPLREQGIDPAIAFAALVSAGLVYGVEGRDDYGKIVGTNCANLQGLSDAQRASIEKIVLSFYNNFDGVDPASFFPAGSRWVNDAVAQAVAGYDGQLSDTQIVYMGSGGGLGFALLETDTQGRVVRVDDAHMQHDETFGRLFADALPKLSSSAAMNMDVQDDVARAHRVLSDAVQRVLRGDIARVAAISDPHGNLTRFREIVSEIERNGAADEIVITGDIFDRDPHGLALLAYITDEIDNGRKFVPLIGNHDVLFLRAMRGDIYDVASWLASCSDTVLREAGIMLSSDEKKKIANVARRSRFMTFSDMDASRKLQSMMRDNALLRDAERRFKSYFRLAYLDRNGTLYTHAGLPVEDARWSYRAKAGLAALNAMNEDFSRDDHAVFDTSLWAFVTNNDWLGYWDKYWHDPVHDFDGDVASYGAMRVIHGHKRQKDISITHQRINRTDGRVHDIDFEMANDVGGRGGYTVMDAGGLHTFVHDGKGMFFRFAYLDLSVLQRTAQRMEGFGAETKGSSAAAVSREVNGGADLTTLAAKTVSSGDEFAFRDVDVAHFSQGISFNVISFTRSKEFSQSFHT